MKGHGPVALTGLSLSRVSLQAHSRIFLPSPERGTARPWKGWWRDLRYRKLSESVCDNGKALRKPHFSITRIAWLSSWSPGIFLDPALRLNQWGKIEPR